MFKKLLSLTAGVALCFSANAERVLDHFIDYSTWTDWNLYEMGYKAKIEDGCLTSENPMDIDEETGEVKGPAWYQYFMAPAWAAEMGQTYYVTFKVKGSEEGSVNVAFRWSWSEDPINIDLPITTDWEEVTLVPEEVGGTNIDMIWQGTYAGKFQCAWIKVEHEAGEQRPEEWIDLLENGDAEGEYGEIPCAYGKEYDDVNKLGTDPHPATIEAMDGGHVFVVHATAVDPNDFLNDEGEQSGAHAWQNQFWIQSPKEWKQGDIFRVSFDYKASTNANTNTQAHKQNPGDYLHWELLGDVAFTTDWQHFEKKVTVNSSQNGMWSAAFNLNPQVFTAIDFYFDNLKWEVLKLDEGYFIAGDFNDKDLNNAVEFNYDDDNEVYWVTVGTGAKPASQIKISTRRGNDSAFNSNCLKIDDTLIEDNEDSWFDYQPTGGSKWVNLPEPGTWTIQIDEAYQQIVFFTSPDGITSVSVDNAPAVYYNLQGVRVDNPSNGVYIVKKGNNVTKQIIRK